MGSMIVFRYKHKSVNGTEKLTKKKRYILGTRKNDDYNLSGYYRFKVWCVNGQWRCDVLPAIDGIGARITSSVKGINFHELRFVIGTVYIIIIPLSEHRWEIEVGMISDPSANAFKAKMEYYANKHNVGVVGFGVRAACVEGKGGHYEKGVEQCLINLKRERLQQAGENGYATPGQIIALARDMMDGLNDYKNGNDDGLFGDGTLPGALADEAARNSFGPNALCEKRFPVNSVVFLPSEFELDMLQPVAEQVIGCYIRGRGDRKFDCMVASSFDASSSLFYLLRRAHVYGYGRANTVLPRERSQAYAAAIRVYIEDRYKYGNKTVPLSMVDVDQVTGQVIGEVDHQGNLRPWARSNGNRGEGFVDQYPSSTDFKRHPNVKPRLYDKYHDYPCWLKIIMGVIVIALFVMTIMTIYFAWVYIPIAYRHMKYECVYSPSNQYSTAVAVYTKEVAARTVCKLLAYEL